MIKRFTGMFGEFLSVLQGGCGAVLVESEKNVLETLNDALSNEQGDGDCLKLPSDTWDAHFEEKGTS